MGHGYTYQPRTAYEGLAATLRTHDQALTRLQGAMANFGLSLDPTGNLVFDSPGHDLIIKGGSNVDIQDDGMLTVAGDATFSGDVDIEGTLALPANSIQDDWLTNPQHSENYSGDTNTFTLTVAGSDVHSGSATVPTGFTRAEVICIGTVGNSRTSGAGGAPFYAEAWVDGTGGEESAVIGDTCVDGGSHSITVAISALLTGLTGGGTITFGVWGAVDSLTGWPSGAANGHVTAAITFLR